MRAAVLHESGAPLVIEDVRLDPPGDGEVLVRVAASGVCHSDIATARGSIPNPLPVVLGHEGAGVVERVGPGVRAVRPGDHVMLSWAPECGRCRLCRTGRPNLCDAYAPRVLDGGLLDGTTRLHGIAGTPIHHYSFLSTFAEQAVVPEASCIPMDPDMPFAPTALIGCAVMTGFGAAVRSGRVRPGDTVAVIGAGGVGVNAIQGARIAGATRIIAVDAEPAKEPAARRYGATDFLDAVTVDVPAAVRELTGGGADVVIEASGHPAAMGSAYAAARRAGTVVFVGVAPADAVVALPAARLPREEKTVTGSFYGGAVPASDFPLLVQLYRQGKLLLDEQIDRILPLSSINDAFRERPTTGVRVVIDPSAGTGTAPDALQPAAGLPTTLP